MSICDKVKKTAKTMAIAGALVAIPMLTSGCETFQRKNDHSKLRRYERENYGSCPKMFKTPNYIIDANRYKK